MQLAVNDRVIASKAIAFGGGVSPWLNRKGTIKKILSARQVLVKLDGDQGSPIAFFARELDKLTEG